MGYEYTSAVPDEPVPHDPEDDVVEPPVFAPLDAAGARELAERYLEDYLLSRGDRAERLARDVAQDPWTVDDVFGPADEVCDRVLHEPDPMPLLDALVALAAARTPVDDHAFLAFVAAGPVEDALVERADLRDAIARRCRRDVAWRTTVQGVWADAALAATFPAPLDVAVTRLGSPDGAVARRAGKRRTPSKRQDRQGRRRHR